MSDLTNRTERIASGIYLVTSFFNDSEPIKWRLRSLSLNLVATDVKDIFNIIKEIISLFSLAKSSNIISDTNYNILVKELSSITHEYELKNSLDFLISKRESLPDETMPKLPTSSFTKEIPNLNKDGDRSILKEFGAVSVKKNRRQSIIISILRRKKEVMIKDITPLISGCSEKTIQRELARMVESGLLKREGEKRWSRYSLA